jgi:PAS domain S-box-containing protein
VAENLTGSKFGLIGEINPEGRFDTISISNPGWDACKMPDSEATKSIQDMEIRGIDRSTIREGKPRIVNDPASHPDRVGAPEGHPPVSAFLGVPLKHAGKIIGMIGLANKASGYDLADQKAIEDLSVAFVEALMRKRAENGLKKSEERFRTVADFTYDWEDWVGPDGKYNYVSPSFERITGYSPHEFLEDHRFFETLLHPDDKAKVERHFLGHNHKHGVRGLDFRIVDRKGETRWISHLCQAVYDREGKWLGRRASNRDITEQKKIEGQLRQAQKMEAIGRLAGGGGP